MTTRLDLIVDRLIAGHPVTVYHLVDSEPCQNPNHSGNYSYTTLGCKCPRCRKAHTTDTTTRRRHALARSRRNHPTNRKTPP